MSSSSSGQRRAAREGFPSSPRLLERRRHQQQEQQEQTQPEEEEEDNDENEDDTGADEFASDDEDSRMGVPGVSQIGVSGVTQSPSRNNNDFSRAPTSSVSRTATARRAPTFPRARQSMQSRGQQFRINEILSLLETISTHLPIGSHEWEVVASQHNENFPDKERTGPSLRRKFSQLHKVKKPTGDPTCPAEVRYAKQIFRRIEQRADASAEIESTDLGIEREPNEPNIDEPNVDDDFIAISGESEDNGGATSAAYANFSGSRFPRPMVSPRFRDKAVSNNTGPVEKVLSLLSTQLLHKATRTDTDCLRQQQQLQQQNMMNMMMMSIMASLLNQHGVSQTTTSTDSANPTQAIMNSIIASNMISMQQTMQSQNPTSTAGANAQQTLSASTQCQTPKNNSGSSSSDDE